MDQWPVPRVTDTTPGESFTTAQGLSSDAVWKVLIDREGSIWVGTNSGLDRLRRTALTTLSLPPAQEHDFSIVAGDLDSIWTGNLSLPLTRVAADGTHHQLSQDCGHHLSSSPSRWNHLVRRRRAESAVAFFRRRVFTHALSRRSVRPGHVARPSIATTIYGSIPQPAAPTISRTANGTGEDDALGRKPGVLGAMAGDDQGNVWFGFSNYLLKWDGSEFQRFSFPNGRRGVSETTMSVRGDHVWLGGTGGVALFTKGRFLRDAVERPEPAGQNLRCVGNRDRRSLDERILRHHPCHRR